MTMSCSSGQEVVQDILAEKDVAEGNDHVAFDAVAGFAQREQLARVCEFFIVDKLDVGRMDLLARRNLAPP